MYPSFGAKGASKTEAAPLPEQDRILAFSDGDKDARNVACLAVSKCFERDLWLLEAMWILVSAIGAPRWDENNSWTLGSISFLVPFLGGRKEEEEEEEEEDNARGMRPATRGPHLLDEAM